MRYLGWILALLLAAAGVAAYFIFYAPLEKGYKQQQGEIAMWTEKVAALEQGHTYVLSDTGDTSPADTGTVEITGQEFEYGKLLATVPLDRMFSSEKSTAISANGKAEIEKLLAMLKTTDGDVVIMVHEDNVRVGQSLRDRYPTNWEYTANRAAVIARYLLERGIDYKRLVPCGLSAARPVASNNSAEDRAKNRRVEIYLR